MSIDVLFNQFPTLTTDRLILRQIRPDDAEAEFAIFSDPETMEFYGDLPHQSIDESRALIGQIQEWYAQRSGIRWGLTFKDQDRLLGSCGFFRFDEASHRAEVGYELNRAYWQQGLMTEALSAIITYAFTQTDLRRIEAVIDDQNQRSKGLLYKLGFTHEGTLRQRFYFRERYLDEHYFGLLKNEWNAPS